MLGEHVCRFAVLALKLGRREHHGPDLRFQRMPNLHRESPPITTSETERHLCISSASAKLAIIRGFALVSAVAVIDC